MRQYRGLVFLAVILCAGVAFGTALTAERNTPSSTKDSIVIGVATNTRIFAGSMVAVSNAYAYPAQSSAGWNVIGRAAATVDNRVNATGAGDNGALNVVVERGVFGWANGDTVTDGNIGDICYVVDDQTVSVTNTGSGTIAGVVVDYDGTYVWVDSYNIDRTALAATTLSVSGATTLDGAVDINEDITIDLNASDEEIDIDATQTSGTASTPLISVDDDRTGATANEKSEATIWIDAEGTYGLAVADGAAYVEGELEVDGTLNADGAMDLDGAFRQDVVIVGDVAAYTNLAANAGKVHIMPDLTADCTVSLPTEADHLYYKIVYAGGAEDAQDWILQATANANFFIGGLVQHDDDDGGDDTVVYYSDGDSNSQLTIYTPNAGTIVELWCDGTNWRVVGTVISGTDTGVAFADQ